MFAKRCTFSAQAVSQLEVTKTWAMEVVCWVMMVKCWLTTHGFYPQGDIYEVFGHQGLRPSLGVYEFYERNI